MAEKKRPWRYALLYLFTLPVDILVWIVVLFIRVAWGHKLEWCEGLWCELRPNSWPAKTWYRYRKNGKVIENPVQYWSVHGKWATWGGTCFGHGGFYGPGKAGMKKGIDSKVEYHEHVHVEQAEVIIFLGALLAIGIFCVSYFYFKQLVYGAWISGGVYFMTFLLKAASGWIVAWLRGEDPYRGSVHEEAAYAIEEQFELAAGYEKKKRGLE